MLHSRKKVPIAFMILSLFYFIFVVSLESSKMIGDEISGDPGSMLLPLLLSIGMFILSTYLFFKEKPVQEESLTKDEQKLFTFTIILCVLYILLYRLIGFIVTSTILLFLLTYTYSIGKISRKNIASTLYGLLFTLLAMLIMYTIGRQITGYLFGLGRSTGIVWISTTFTVFMVTISILTLLFLGLKKLVSLLLAKKMQNNPQIRTIYICSLVTIATVELLFLVFRQLFLVNLSHGFINW